MQNGSVRHFDEPLSKRVARIADGKWADILQSAGISSDCLRNKKVQCPMHDGPKGKFRFENKDGNGNWHCAVCGHGDGMKLLMMATAQNFTEAALWVIEHLNDADKAPRPNLAPRRPGLPAGKSESDISRRRANFEKVWNEAAPVTEGDPVSLYLHWRVPGLDFYPATLRFHRGLPFFGQPGDNGAVGKNYGLHPCMVAAVVDETGRACNIHRTFLTHAGRKLALQEPDGDDSSVLVNLPAKKLMPSVGAKHYQIRLAKPINGELGIAEGIESALAANVYSGISTWSLVADTGIVNFWVPPQVTSLVIFADNDLRTVRGGYPGLDAARRLVERQDVQARITDGSLKVVIRTPATPGTDMANFLQELAPSL